MNTKPVTGGKAFAASNFGRTQKNAKNVGRKIQQNVGRQVQQAKRQVTTKFPGADRELWLPNAERPSWLDGSLPGDRGFDPLGLAKPVDYIQFAPDKEGAPLWEKGEVSGNYSAPQRYVASSPIAPWNDAFGLDRFRENEIINGRWAMLAVLGILVGEAVTGVPWQDAGKVELDAPTYWGQKLPFSISQTVVLEVLLVGSAETFRSQAKDVEDRIYPGGVFDPLKLAAGDSEFELREAEVKHCRLAMTAFAGLSLQAMWRGTGAFASIQQTAVETGVPPPPLPAA